MNSVTNKTRLAEKRYRDKLKQEIRFKTKKHKNEFEKIKKMKKIVKSTIDAYNHQIRQQNYKKNEYELNKRRKLIRKQTESNSETKQNERKQKRQNILHAGIF